MKWPRFPLAHRKNRKYPFPLEEYEEDDLAVAVVVAGHLGQAVVQGAEERSMQSGTPRGVDYRPFTRRTLLHKRKLNHFKRRIRLDYKTIKPVRYQTALPNQKYTNEKKLQL